MIRNFEYVSFKYKFAICKKNSYLAAFVTNLLHYKIYDSDKFINYLYESDKNYFGESNKVDLFARAFADDYPYNNSHLEQIYFENNNIVMISFIKDMLSFYTDSDGLEEFNNICNHDTTAYASDVLKEKLEEFAKIPKAHNNFSRTVNKHVPVYVSDSEKQPKILEYVPYMLMVALCLLSLDFLVKLFFHIKEIFSC